MPSSFVKPELQPTSKWPQSSKKHIIHKNRGTPEGLVRLVLSVAVPIVAASKCSAGL